MNKFNKYALYFKDEATCPFLTDSNEYYYWYQEKNFSNVPDKKIDHYIDFAKKNPDDFNPISRLLHSDLVPEPNKGLLCFAIDNWLNNSPQTDLSFWGEYGRGKFDDAVFDGPIPENCDSFNDLPEDNKNRIKEDLIKSCLYYKGEKENPFPQSSINSTYWEIEFIWVNEFFFDDTMRSSAFMEFTDAYPDMLNGISSKVPTSLKSLLFLQYTQKGGSSDGFEKILLQYIESFLLVNS